MASPSSPDPACPICSKPVELGTFVLFDHGDWFHVRCVSRTEQLRAMEQGSRFKDAMARAEEVVARARRLINEATGLQRKGFGACAVCGRPFKQGEGYIRRDGRPIHIGCRKEEPTP